VTSEPAANSKITPGRLRQRDLPADIADPFDFDSDRSSSRRPGIVKAAFDGDAMP